MPHYIRAWVPGGTFPQNPRTGQLAQRKGFARVRLGDGSLREAEVHWYEASGLGKFEFKIKRYTD